MSRDNKVALTDNNTKDSPANASATNSTAVASETAASPPAPNVTLPKRPLMRAEASYLRIQHLSDAYSESELVRVTTDLEETSITALGASAKIKAAREEVLRKLPNHDMVYFDAWEDIAWALSYVAAQVNATEEENRVLTEQADLIKGKINELKNFLVTHAKAADINMVPLRKLGAEFGYKPMLTDAGTVLEIMTKHWDKLASKLPEGSNPVEELDQAVADFRIALGEREQNPEGPRQELIRRRRVNTLFRAAVANIREAIIYTYGESRVGEFVPGFSNASNKTSSRGSKEEQEEQTPDAEPAVGQGTTPAPVRPSGFVLNNPENLPITSPFIEEDDTGNTSGSKKRSA